MTTASTRGSRKAGSASGASCAVGKRAFTCSRRLASRSTTQATSLVSLLSKLRIRFGPQWPAPTTAMRIIWLLLQSQPQEDQGPQDRPPPGDRLHLRLSLLLRGIDLGDRALGEAVAEADGLEQQVRLQLVLVQPVLVERDARVL